MPLKLTRNVPISVLEDLRHRTLNKPYSVKRNHGLIQGLDAFFETNFTGHPNRAQFQATVIVTMISTRSCADIDESKAKLFLDEYSRIKD
jgi:hypothetical protein